MTRKFIFASPNAPLYRRNFWFNHWFNQNFPCQRGRQSRHTPAGSLDILDLLPHLFYEHLQIHTGVAGIDMRRL